jgi:hypothetical protein
MEALVADRILHPAGVQQINDGGKLSNNGQ